MRFLLDTNILIPLEDSSRPLFAEYAAFDRMARENGHILLTHPASETDIRRDNNQERRDSTLSRLRRYSPLEAAPRKYPEKNLTQLTNDEADDEMLFSLERNAISFLLTEDQGVHKKAGRLALGDRVLYVTQAVALLSRLHEQSRLSFPNITDAPLHSLHQADQFFDSLREVYAEFDQWYQRVSREGRRAWIYQGDDERLGALCIFKEEERPNLPGGTVCDGRALKLCTFKVAEHVRGRRVGELFLKSAFRYAFSRGICCVYLTMRADQATLADLCVRYGFSCLGSDGRDLVYLKEVPRAAPCLDIPPLAYHIKYAPCVRIAPTVGTFIIPIQPRFHSLLFPEISDQMTLFHDRVIGNGITLAYLSRARVKGLSPGDAIAFYRSGDIKSVTTIGVIESTFTTSALERIIEAVAKRTVYSIDDIRAQLDGDAAVRVILFRLAFHLQSPIHSSLLIQAGILNGAPQTIQRITPDRFQSLIQHANAEGLVLAS